MVAQNYTRRIHFAKAITVYTGAIVTRAIMEAVYAGAIITLFAMVFVKMIKATINTLWRKSQRKCHHHAHGLHLLTFGSFVSRSLTVFVDI